MEKNILLVEKVDDDYVCNSSNHNDKSVKNGKEESRCSCGLVTWACKYPICKSR